MTAPGVPLSALRNHCGSIPGLFAYLYSQLANRKTIDEITLTPWVIGDEPGYSFLYGELETSQTDSVPDLIIRYLEGENCLGEIGLTDGEPLRRAFVVAMCIDESFECIHPRGRAGRPPSQIAGGYSRIRSYERRNGYYFFSEDLGYVLAKGPLKTTSSHTPLTEDEPDVETPEPEEMDAGEMPDDGGDHAEARDSNKLPFNFLSILRWDSEENGATLEFLSVSRKRISLDGVRDIRVGIVPLAEGPDDLTFNVLQRGGKQFIDVGVGNSALLAARAARAIEKLNERGAHVGIFPELCVDEDVRESIQLALSTAPAGGRTLELVIAGSGCFGSTMDEAAFNESAIFNGHGDLLFTQQKLNWYDMAAERVSDLGLVPGSAGNHTENIRRGNKLTVLEVPGLGRIIVLICEDLKRKAGANLCEHLQMDWIFSPILDFSIETHRWSASRSWFLAQEWQTRTVAATSMTMDAMRHRANPPAASVVPKCGIAISVDPSSNGRSYRLEEVDLFPGDSPHVSIVEWDPANWMRFTVR